MKNFKPVIGLLLTVAVLAGCRGNTAVEPAVTSEPATASNAAVTVPETTAAAATTAMETTALTTSAAYSPRPELTNLSGMKQTLTELPEYKVENGIWRPVDLRQKDLSSIDVSGNLDSLLHAEFDAATVWPETLPAGFDPAEIMKSCMTPGLGIETLREQGITGSGVAIAIIDKPLYLDHSEYKDRIVSYEDLSADKYDFYQAELHSAFMTSVAAGKNCGVANEASVYFLSASVWSDDGSTLSWLAYAKAVDRVLEINQTLPDSDKRRAISISASWAPGDIGYDELEAAIKRATDAGIFVVTCNMFIDSGYTFCFQGLDISPVDDKNDLNSYNVIEWPQWLSMQREDYVTYYTGEFAAHAPDEILLVPMDSIASAELTGPDDYMFNRIGGWSAAEPYMAGLYALACQVKPDITPTEFWAAALATGDVKEITIDDVAYTGKVANPVALAESLGA
jgi:subtilisin family serine protease